MLYDRDLRNDASRDASRSTVGMILSRIVSEIDNAAETLQDLQTSLSPALLQTGDPTVVAKAQGLDLLEQIMRDLSVVMARIAEDPAASHPLDATVIADRCKLSNVALRLRGLSAEPLPHSVDFF